MEGSEAEKEIKGSVLFRSKHLPNRTPLPHSLTMCCPIAQRNTGEMMLTKATSNSFYVRVGALDAIFLADGLPVLGRQFYRQT
ncbi:hypothetical protein CEXT_585141 [Caerostris extrusa]|uniref:Uncharacterized protein n=1 Tax=Caerostris extrusa TaxID=172846 RepID=A0AAV4QFP2_CAEEX|nr:hypothetical protein CEXT_585141 [Caerostris extrusa]